MAEINEGVLDLSHLTTQAQALARLPAYERINRIRAERSLDWLYLCASGSDRVRRFI